MRYFETGGGVLIRSIMHGRNVKLVGRGGVLILYMAVVLGPTDPRILKEPGQSTSGFHGPGRH